MLEGWINKYADGIQDTAMALMCMEEFTQLLRGRDIIVYGYGNRGKLLLPMLKDLGLTVSYIIDKISEDAIVKRPKYLLSIENVAAYVVIAAVQQEYISDIYKDVRELNIKDVNLQNGEDIYALLKNCFCEIHFANIGKVDDCLQCLQCPKCFRCLTFARHFTGKTGLRISADAKDQSFLTPSIKLGTICTLKCRDCAEGIPYALHRFYYDVDDMVLDIQHLASAFEFIPSLGVCGGEPFVYPYLAELIERFLSINNIGIIAIFTNGTLQPNKQLLSVLKNERVIIQLSNYSQIGGEYTRKFIKTKNVLKENNIQHWDMAATLWRDFMSFEKTCDDEMSLKMRFSACRYNARLGFLLSNGKIYYCNHDLTGITTGKAKYIERRINVRDYDVESLRVKIYEAMSVEYHECCKYCSAPFNLKVVPAAVQLES